MRFKPRYSIYLLIPALILITLIYSRGFSWPDEIFQTLEPAHNFLFGKGSMIWEFGFQARSFLYPFIISFFLFLYYLFSNSTEGIYFYFRILISILFFISILKIYFSFLKNREENFLSTFLFLIIIGLMPTLYYFGFRTLTESISTAIIAYIIFHLELNIEKLNKTNILYYSIILSSMYGIRFQTGLFFIVFYPLFSIKLIQSKKEKLIFNFLIGAILGLIIYGISDFLAYKFPFISTYNYIYYNLVKKISLNFGTEPWYYFIKVIVNDFSILLVFIGIGIFNSFKDFYSTIFGLLFFFIAHSFIAHKEARFIFLIYPFLGYFLLIGVFFILDKINSKYKTLTISFISLLIILVYFNSYKKINWNLGRENLEIFFKISKLNLKKEKILVTESVDFSTFGGYVFLGKKFQGEIVYRLLKLFSEIEEKKVMSKNFDFILTNKSDLEKYCNKYRFCKIKVETKNCFFLSRIEKNEFFRRVNSKERVKF